MRTSKILSLSLPPTLLREAERLAKKEGRTKSELFREALRRYLPKSEGGRSYAGTVPARHARWDSRRLTWSASSLTTARAVSASGG